MTETKAASHTYKFDQLGPKGKSAAIEQYRQDSASYDDDGNLEELLTDDLSDHHGVTNCKLSYSLGYCQGDGVAFAGNPDIDHWAEHDEHLAGLLLDLRAWAVLCHEEEPDINLKITNDGRYSHRESMSLDLVNEADWNTIDENCPLWAKQELVEEYLTHAIKDISRALKETGYAEIEWQDSDEYIAGTLSANDYEFTRKGERL